MLGMDPLPNNGAVYPRWFLDDNRWSTVISNEAIRLGPHINLKNQAQQVQSLRVFASGSNQESADIFYDIKKSVILWGGWVDSWCRYSNRTMATFHVQTSRRVP